MADYRGSSQELEAFKSILDSYIGNMRQEIAAMNSKSEVAKSRIRDGAVSGAINHFIGLYDNIDEDLNMLEKTSKTLGEMILRFRRGEEVGKRMQDLNHGRRR